MIWGNKTNTPGAEFLESAFLATSLVNSYIHWSFNTTHPNPRVFFFFFVQHLRLNFFFFFPAKPLSHERPVCIFRPLQSTAKENPCSPLSLFLFLQQREPRKNNQEVWGWNPPFSRLLLCKGTAGSYGFVTCWCELPAEHSDCFFFLPLASQLGPWSFSMEPGSI